MMRKTIVILVAVCLPAFGDFSYEQTAKLTGGMLAGMMKFAGVFSKQAREPMVTTVAVKGDRMLHAGAHQAKIIDLEKETITDINFDKKQYSVMSFDQMKQAMAQASQQMKGNNPNTPDMNFKVSTKDTGQKRQIAGFDTHEVVLTVDMVGTDQQSGQSGGMQVVSDMWLAPKVTGYDEIPNFYKRMMQKLNWAPSALGGLSNRPDLAKGFAAMYQEGSKLDGMPVFETVRMGGQGQAAAGAPPPSQAPQNEPRAEEQQTGIGGLLGGLGRRKKSQDQEQQPGSGDASGALMEMSMEISAFSNNAVDAAKFEIPAGFKQVEPEELHQGGRRRR